MAMSPRTESLITILVPATSAMICSNARTSMLWNDSEIFSPVYGSSLCLRSSSLACVSGCSSIVYSSPA
jgi:hypothetical protein